MRTIIEYNGSKWAGEDPDDLDTLLRLLRTEALDPRFAGAYGTYSHLVTDHLPWTEADRLPHLGYVRFSGNFLHISHAFSIVTDDPVIIGALHDAIRCNPSYRGR